MKLNRTILFLVFLGSIFMGIVGISIGLGTSNPRLNHIAQPFICPRGEMEVKTRTYSPYPGELVTTLTWYCLDEETGEKTELSIIAMTLYSGLIYGLMVFIVIAVGLYLYSYLYEKWEFHTYFRTPDGRKMEERIAYGLGTVILIGLLWYMLRIVLSGIPI